MKEFGNKIVDFFKNAGLDILYGIIILVVGLLLCALIKAVLKKILLRRGKHDEAMVNFVAALVDIVLKIIVLITALATMGINTASIIAVIGTCGVAIGLALKDSLGNIASGIMIIFNKPFKKDDYVEIAGEEGRITNINLFNTTLKTDDDTVIIVPNSEAVNNPIINYEGCKFRRIVVDIAVDKGSEIAEVRDIVDKVATAEELLAKENVLSPFSLRSTKARVVKYLSSITKPSVFTFSFSRTFSITSIPAFCNFLIPFPATIGLTSRIPITTFFIPRSIIKSAQGGVLP